MGFTIEQAEKALLIAAQGYHVDSADSDDEAHVLRAALAYADAKCQSQAVVPATKPAEDTEDIFFVGDIPPGEVFRTVDHEPGSMICGMKLALVVSISSLTVYVDGKDGSLQMMSPTTRVRLCSVC